MPRAAIWYRHEFGVVRTAGTPPGAPRVCPLTPGGRPPDPRGMVECAAGASPGAPDEICGVGGWDNGCMALEESVDLKLDTHNKDGIEIVDVEGEIDVYTAPRLRELLIDLVNNQHYHLI